MRYARRYTTSELVTAAAYCMTLAVMACGEQEPPPLTNAERELVAQGYADSVRAIAQVTDSLCALRQPDLVAYFADSLYEVRLGDIERQAAGRGEE